MHHRRVHSLHLRAPQSGSYRIFTLWMVAAISTVAAFGDRLERIAYNALPAPFKPDMWAHQYFQQANQVECTVDENRNWTTPWEDANLFGLEPAYGCCTANMHQGWPKFVSHMWMATRDEGSRWSPTGRHASTRACAVASWSRSSLTPTIHFATRSASRCIPNRPRRSRFTCASRRGRPTRASPSTARSKVWSSQARTT